MLLFNFQEQLISGHKKRMKFHFDDEEDKGDEVLLSEDEMVEDNWETDSEDMSDTDV